MRLFDTHCHLTWDEEQQPALPRLERAREAGVAGFVCVSIDLDNALRCRELAAEHADVYPSVGIHPNDVGEAAALPSKLAKLRDLAQDPSFVAIGETGLDFFRDWADPKVQHDALVGHLQVAVDRDLPVILHCRDAMDGLLPVLRDFAPDLRGIMHCYSAGPGTIEELVTLGMHISFAGNLTYPKSQELRDACRLVPEERLLVETDAPFLAPQPRRGKKNEPAFVAFTLEALATEREVDATALADTTFVNAQRVFGLQT